MYRAKVTSKGQVTIPAEVRSAMGLTPGEKIVFFKRENGEFIVRKVGSILDLAGCLSGFDVPKSDEEMNQMLADRAAVLDDATKSNATPVSDGEAA
jgi:antitoxin PrlF